MLPKFQNFCSVHPVVPAAVACILGTMAGLALPLWSLTPVLWLFLVSIPLSVAAYIFFRRRKSFGKYLSVICFIAVASLFHAQRADLPYDTAADMLCQIAETDSRCVVTGEVIGVWAPSQASHGELKYRFSLKNCAVKFEGEEEFRPLVGLLPVTWYGKRIEAGGFAPERGMGIEVKAKVCRRKDADLSSSSIEDYFVVARQSSTKILPSDNSGPGILEKWRRASADRIALGLDYFEEEKSLLQAMMFGYRSKIPKQTNTAFRHAGTIHIFAISGLHVLLIAKILKKILSYAGVSATWMILPLAPLLGFYIFATGGQPSAMRAGLMCLFYCAAPLFGRKPDSLNSISLAALVLLVVDPVQLRELGFILSFVMVLGLILFGAKIHNLVLRLFCFERQAEYLNLKEIGFAKDTESFVHSDWDKWVFRFQKWLFVGETNAIGYFSTAITATLVSLPLTSYYFGYFTTFSVIANVIVVPLAFVTMSSAGIGLLLSCLWDVFAVPFNIFAALCTLVMKKISFWCVSLPGSTQYAALPLWGVLAWYVVLIISFNIRKKGNIGLTKKI